jgi:hypothetical protein
MTKVLRALFALLIGLAMSRAVWAQPAGQAFYGQPAHWTDGLYASVGGQWARLSGLQLSTDGACGAPDDLFAVCGAGASLSSANGGGFRVELGTVMARLRPYISFAGNYGWHPTGALTPTGLFFPNTMTADAQAQTLIVGLGLDSARLVPNMLPPNVNLFVQGGIGVSWNRLSNAHIDFPGVAFSVDLPETTNTSFAGEAGVGMEYAFTPAFALRAGYNSRWIGSFRSQGAVTLNAFGTSAPIAIQPIASDHARVDEVYGALVVRLGALFGR